MAAVCFRHDTVHQCCRLLLAAMALLLVLCLPARAEEWKYDVVTLKSEHRVLKGLLVRYSETAEEIELRAVNRKPGERTRVETFLFKRSQVESVETISAEERAVLEERIRAWTSAARSWPHASAS